MSRAFIYPILVVCLVISCLPLSAQDEPECEWVDTRIVPLIFQSYVGEWRLTVPFMEVLGGRLPKRVRLEAFSDNGEQDMLFPSIWSWNLMFGDREGEAGYGSVHFPTVGIDTAWLELRDENCSGGLPPDFEVDLSMNVELQDGDDWSLVDMLRIPGVKPGKGFVVPAISHTRTNSSTLVHRKTAVSIVNPSHDESARVTLKEDYEGEVCQAKLTIPPRNRVVKHLDDFTSSCEFRNDARITTYPLRWGVWR